MLMHFLAPDRRSVLFAIKGLTAACLALTVAMYLDVDKPFWAVVASMMLQARPEAGLVIEKALFLVLGSFLGALIALIILTNFAQHPELALGSLALCAGVTSMFAATVRHVNFVYAFSLVSVTATLIVLFAIGDTSTLTDASIFHIARARLIEVIIGASSASLVSMLLFPWPVGRVLEGHVRSLQDAVSSHATALFRSGTGAAELDAQRRAIVLAASILNDDANAGRYENARQADLCHRLANKSLSLLALSRAIEHLRQDRNIPDGFRSALDARMSDLLPALLAKGAADALVIDPATTRGAYYADEVSGFFRILRQVLHPADRDGGASLKARRFISHRDPLIGAYAALRSILVFLCSCGIWIYCGGTSSSVMMMVVPVLFAQMFAGAPVAGLVVRKILIGGLAAIPLAIFVELGILAQVTGHLPLLLMIFGGPLFVALMGMTKGPFMPYSLGFCLTYVVSVQPGNYMTFAADRSLVAGLGVVMGLLVLNTAFSALRAPGGAYFQRRTNHAIARALRRVGRGPFDEIWFNRQMGERLLHLHTHRVGSERSARLMAFGFCGLDLGHQALKLHERLHDGGDPLSRAALEAWHEALADAFLTGIDGGDIARMDLAAEELISAVRDTAEQTTSSYVVSAVSRVRQDLTHLAHVTD